ncbi:hypothetical protein [Marinobacterium lutimaris]|uniref:Antirestriction protein ArdR n=1 Tax=Marinobacterium lutimaris TaxID=568106 RepID=A0A1H5XVK3_9GAMM|nr:hypothetical protein [Marinobacterium lutimaris]SEG15794.1 hypothetical protein SAMN05444390_1011521 [Marinobacterium lutimaris]
MNLIERARYYREQHNHPDGVIIIAHGTEYAGWMNELRNPEMWTPGCIAIDPEGNQWEATGGGYRTAERWEVRS